jgi:hypothetical protein
MPYQQRDIIKVARTGIAEAHPFLIISSDISIQAEQDPLYVGVMLTHTQFKNRFTIPITPDMVDGSITADWQQVRMHMIASFRESHISKDATKYLGKMKVAHFNAVLDQIKDYIFAKAK